MIVNVPSVLPRGFYSAITIKITVSSRVPTAYTADLRNLVQSSQHHATYRCVQPCPQALLLVTSLRLGKCQQTIAKVAKTEEELTTVKLKTRPHME